MEKKAKPDSLAVQTKWLTAWAGREKFVVIDRIQLLTKDTRGLHMTSFRQEAIQKLERFGFFEIIGSLKKDTPSEEPPPE